MALTLNSTIGDLLKDEKVVKILDKYIPGASKNPQLGMVKALSINMILNMPQAEQVGITKEVAEKIIKEANAVLSK
jgi:hypothetical protein